MGEPACLPYCHCHPRPTSLCPPPSSPGHAGGGLACHIASGTLDLTVSLSYCARNFRCKLGEGRQVGVCSGLSRGVKVFPSPSLSGVPGPRACVASQCKDPPFSVRPAGLSSWALGPPSSVLVHATEVGPFLGDSWLLVVTAMAPLLVAPGSPVGVLFPLLGSPLTWSSGTPLRFFT